MRVARYTKGVGQTELANKLGITYTNLSKYEQGHRIPTADLLERIAKELDCEPGWLLAGKTEKDKYIHDYLEGYVFVPQMVGEISAGYGVIPNNSFEIKIAFREDWIRKKGDPRDMSLIQIKGDSMEPTLLSGDLVLVDHSKTSIDAQGGIYTIALDDQIMIKRLQLLYPSQLVRIISDNLKYEATEVDAQQVKINGKVIWFGREIEK